VCVCVCGSILDFGCSCMYRYAFEEVCMDIVLVVISLSSCVTFVARSYERVQQPFEESLRVVLNIVDLVGMSLSLSLSLFLSLSLNLSLSLFLSLSAPLSVCLCVCVCTCVCLKNRIAQYR